MSSVAEGDVRFTVPLCGLAATGTPLEAVLSRLRAGEPLREVAEDFDLGEDEVAEAADRAQLVVA